MKTESLLGNTASASLASALRHSTMKVHKSAERCGFVKSLFHGTCSNKDYLQYLLSLQSIYAALEQGLKDNSSHADVAPIFFEQLFRSQALKSDIVIWQAKEAAELRPKVRTAAQAYADRVRALANSMPALLVGHAYVRYLGDLSGGQALAEALVRNGHTSGLEFYRFENVEPMEMKNTFREALDKIGGQSPALAIPICEEAELAFHLTSSLFTAIEESAK